MFESKSRITTCPFKILRQGSTKVFCLSGSFYDGSVFCALVHSMDSELIDWSHVLEVSFFFSSCNTSKDTPKNNLEKAFSAAEKLGIPRMLDTEDMTNPQLSLRPDEKCIMTY